MHRLLLLFMNHRLVTFQVRNEAVHGPRADHGRTTTGPACTRTVALVIMKKKKNQYPWKTLGEALRELREWRDYSQEQLLEKTRLRETVRSWSRYEAGERKLRREELIRLIVSGFEVADLAKLNRLLALGRYAPVSLKEAGALGIQELSEAVALANAEFVLKPHIRIWWPEPGCKVSGEQPFKALIPELPLSEYVMYWQKEGDNQQHEMIDVRDANPHADHKEAWVWIHKWFPTCGPNRVEFVAADFEGKEITRQAVEFYCDPDIKEG
jgi:transcriptional regulator with XRE-family HTH domain